MALTMFSQPGGLALLCFLLGLQGSPAAGAAGMLGCWRRVDGGLPGNPVRRAEAVGSQASQTSPSLLCTGTLLFTRSICWLRCDLLSFQRAHSAQAFAGRWRDDCCRWHRRWQNYFPEIWGEPAVLSWSPVGMQHGHPTLSIWKPGPLQRPSPVHLSSRTPGFCPQCFVPLSSSHPTHPARHWGHSHRGPHQGLHGLSWPHPRP